MALMATQASIAWALWRMQNAINHIAGVPDGSSNARFSGANWFWMVLGIIFWVLAILAVTTWMNEVES
jgi:hypothetical protein